MLNNLCDSYTYTERVLHINQFFPMMLRMLFIRKAKRSTISGVAAQRLALDKLDFIYLFNECIKERHRFCP